MSKKKDELLDIEPNETETFSMDGCPMAGRRGNLQVMKHVTLTSGKKQIREALLLGKYIFGDYLRTQECPICWGTGVVGDDGEMTLPVGVVGDDGEMILPGRLTTLISPESLRECPLCKGSGVLALDVVTLTYYRIAVTGDASVETKIKELRKEYNQTTNQRKEQPWKQ